MRATRSKLKSRLHPMRGVVRERLRPAPERLLTKQGRAYQAASQAESWGTGLDVPPDRGVILVDREGLRNLSRPVRSRHAPHRCFRVPSLPLRGSRRDSLRLQGLYLTTRTCNGILGTMAARKRQSVEAVRSSETEMTFNTFLRIFPDNDACLAYLREKFYPNGS